MKNKLKWIIIYLIFAAVVYGAVYYFILNKKGGYSEKIYVPLVPQAATVPASKNVVSYTDAGFSPGTITIKAGDTVIWVNNSSNPLWVASAVHPTHGVYPTTGGCLGSTFDACKGFDPGTSWSFKFDSKGSWKYHDHLNPGARGKVVVE